MTNTDRLAGIIKGEYDWPDRNWPDDMRWLIARVRELEAELSRDRAQGGLTPTYASGIHAPNMQGCTQERDHG